MATREAQKLITRARSGDALARLQLGRLYLNGGEGLPSNPAAALMWLVGAWKGGCADVAQEIAEIAPPDVFAGDQQGLADDYRAACYQAAEQGSPSAAYALGEMCKRAGQIDDALNYFRSAAEGGHSRAAACLGRLLIDSAADDAHPADAIRWLTEAARRGEATAVAPLTEILWQQRDVAAIPWLRSLADQGDATAMVRLAQLLLSPPDKEHFDEAKRWLTLAARQDHPTALWQWGRLQVRWLRGDAYEGIARHSPRKAIDLLERAADRGVAEAHWDLARIYEQPQFSMRDLGAARRHLDAAARAGIAGAQVRLARRLMLKRNDLEAWLEAGHWLTAAMEDEAYREIANALLDEIADRAPAWPTERRDAQRHLLPKIEQSHPRLAARLRLAAEFGLTTREALFVDPVAADQGWCLVVDLRQHFQYKPWRLIRVESAAQRDALRSAVDAALPSFGGEREENNGATRTRARRLESTLVHGMQIDPAIFIQDWQPPQ